MFRLASYETTQPMVSRFFHQALTSHTLAHAYILKGQNLEEMYNIALGIAKILNCENTHQAGEACEDCPSCKWIQKNSHPAVMTVSRLTYLVSDQGKDLNEDDLIKLSKKTTQQTQIKAEQMSRLITQLGVSSPYCRVIIFTDAEERPLSDPSNITPPSEWRIMPNHEEKSFHLLPLNKKVLNTTSANRFLKTLEEPPANTLFFFLSDSEENLLETIVSRCQVVPFKNSHISGGMYFPEQYASFFQHLMQQLKDSRDFYPMLQTFDAHLIQEDGLTLPQALNYFQQYLHQTFQTNAITHEKVKGYTALQKKIEHAQQMLLAKTNPEQVMSQLFYHMSQST